MSCRKKKAQFHFDEFENFSVKIPWDCFVYILTKFLNFEMFMKKGSKRLFVRESIRFTADKPHDKGDKYVFKSDRTRAIIEIKKLDLL